MGNTNIPVVSLATTILLAASTIIFVINVSKGVQITTTQLSVMNNFSKKMLEPLVTAGIVYSVAAVFALCVGILALFADFINCNSRLREYRSHRFCEGLNMCLMMILLLIATLLGWIWILQKAIEIKFINIIYKELCLYGVGESKCIAIGPITSWATPKDYVYTFNCMGTGRFQTYCDSYIKKSAEIYDTTAVCAVLICICLINYLMCMASHFSFYNRQAKLARTRQGSSSPRRSFSQTSSNRSQRSSATSIGVR